MLGETAVHRRDYYQGDEGGYAPNLKSTKDYYKILGLNFDAKPDEIKKAFRRATVKYHPDVNKDGKKIFLEIKEAYEVLIDENERKKYDFIKGYDILRKQKQHQKTVLSSLRVIDKLFKSPVPNQALDKKNFSLSDF